MADDELATALTALLDAGAGDARSVRDDAADVAASVSRDSPGARDAWADAFGASARTFEDAATRGLPSANGATPVLRRLLDRDPLIAATYARRMAALAMAAASLGELTISALATATVVGNAQLAAAGETSVPSPAAVVPVAPGAPARRPRRYRWRRRHQEGQRRVRQLPHRRRASRSSSPSSTPWSGSRR